MVEYHLIAEPPLAGTDISIGDVRLEAKTDMSIVSIALPLERESEAETALKAAYKIQLPESGHSLISRDGMRVIRTAIDQALILLPEMHHSPERIVSEKLKGTVYTTDQTDVWAALSLEGSGALAVLERVCPLDLDASVFPKDAAARTMMEHLGVMIIRTDDRSFLLLSASSSAASFLHMLEISMKNVAPTDATLPVN